MDVSVVFLVAGYLLLGGSGWETCPLYTQIKKCLIYTYLVLFSKAGNHFTRWNLVFRIREVSPVSALPQGYGTSDKSRDCSGL